MKPGRPLAAIAVAALITALAPAAADAATSRAITGRITDSAGKALAGITVVAERDFESGYYATTRADGTYTVEVPDTLTSTELCAGGYIGGTAIDHRVNDGCVGATVGRPADLSLSYRGYVRGTITDVAGKPVAGATVVGCAQRSGALGDTSPFEPDQKTTTEADGTYKLLMPDDLISITASKTGYVTTDYKDAGCDGRSYGENVPTSMPSGRDLTGIDIGLPKPGAVVKGVERPYVAGTAHVGWTVTARPGVWSPAAGEVEYQWFIGGYVAEGANKSTFTIPSRANGSSLSVRVTARRSGYVSAVREIEVGTVTAAPVLPNVRSIHRPYAVGTPKVGWKLSARPGTWSPAAVTVTYRWTIGGKVVSTTPTFRSTAAQKGKSVSLTATASAKGYRSASRTVPAGVIR